MARSLKLLAVAILLIALTLSSTQRAFAADVIDQKQEVPGGSASILGNSPIGQEFQPSMATLVAVEVLIETMNPQLGDDAITLNVRQGTITGTIIANASRSLTVGFSGWLHFAFGSVSVTTGSTYVIQLTATKNTFAWRYDTHNLYPAGAAIFVGTIAPSSDFTFRTYAPSAPTPSSPSTSPVGGYVEPANMLAVFSPYLALLGVVAVAAVVWKKREN